MRKCISFILSILMLMHVVCFYASAGQIVKENDEISLPSSFTASVENKDELQKLPVDVKAKSVILMEANTGEVLMEYNADTKLYPASVTKIMTLLLIAEAIDQKKISLTDNVTCSSNAASKGGSQIWLEEGEVMTVDELLRATVIGSANDAATLLGEFVAGSEESFISLMNERAKELGMKNTNFVNATGLDDTTNAHLTTARDIAIMSRELLKYDFITDYTTVWMDSLRNGKTELVNTNKLVRFYEGTTGLKTGTTAKAGCCISASAKRDGLHLIAVVMGSANSNDRFNTAKNMMSWGFANYTLYTPRIPKKEVKEVNVICGEEESVSVKLPKLSPILLKKGEEEKVDVTVDIADSAQAPVLKGQTVGTVTVSVGNKKVKEYNITSATEIKKLTLYTAMVKILRIVCS